MFSLTQLLQSFLNFPIFWLLLMSVGRWFQSSDPLNVKLFFAKDSSVLVTIMFPLRLHLPKISYKYSGCWDFLMLNICRSVWYATNWLTVNQSNLSWWHSFQILVETLSLFGQPCFEALGDFHTYHREGGSISRCYWKFPEWWSWDSCRAQHIWASISLLVCFSTSPSVQQWSCATLNCTLW